MPVAVVLSYRKDSGTLLTSSAGCCFCDGTMDGELEAMWTLLSLFIDGHIPETAAEYRHVFDGTDSRGRRLSHIPFAQRVHGRPHQPWSVPENPYYRLIHVVLGGS